jgi:ribose transport system substrate-binding protein
MPVNLRRWVFVSCVILATTTVLAACGGGSDDGASTSDSSADAPASDSKKKVRLAYVAAQANSVFKSIYDGVNEIAQKDGAVEIDRLDTGFDPTKQFSVMQDAIASGRYDGMIVVPLDAVGLVPQAEAAVAADIALVNVNSQFGDSFVTVDPQVEGQVGSVLQTIENIGTGQGELIIGACKDIDPCKVGWIAGDAKLPFEVYERKIREGLVAKHDNIELVTFLDGGAYLTEEGYKIAQDLLQAHPDVNVIATAGDQMGRGAELALKDIGRLDEIKITGEGSSKYGVKAVRDGRWYGTVTYAPLETGRVAADLAIRAARDEKLSVGVNPVEEAGFPQTFNQDNLKEFPADFAGEWDT